MALIVRKLFGGAIDLKIPENYIDASDIRQVPDAQEVFIAPDSARSIIMEILQSVPPTDPKDAARFIFDSLAHDNDASFWSLSEISLPDLETAEGRLDPIIAGGTQRICKFNETQEDEVLILLSIHRLPIRAVDLVITENIPLSRETSSQLSSEAIQDIKKTFREIARSMFIADHNLFA